MRIGVALLLVSLAYGQYPAPGGVPGSGGGGGGGGSVFAGSRATVVSYSATPTFSLADVTSQSPVRFQVTLTGAVTSVTISNKTAGAKFSIAWIQDNPGGRLVDYNGAVANSCTVWPVALKTTIQQFEVLADGSTVQGTSCSTDDQGIIWSGPETSAPGTPSSGQTGWLDSTDHVPKNKNSSGTVSVMPVVKAARTANQFLINIPTTGIQTTAQPIDADIAFTDITTGDVSTSAHGFTPKLPNDSSKFLNGVGAYATISTAAPDVMWLPLANNFNETDCRVMMLNAASSQFPAVATLIQGTTYAYCLVGFTTGNDVFGYMTLNLPGNWGGALTLYVDGVTGTTNTGNTTLSVATQCYGASATITTVSYNTAATATFAGIATINKRVPVTFSSVNVTGCSAGDQLNIRVGRLDVGNTLTGSIYLRALGVKFQ